MRDASCACAAEDKVMIAAPTAAGRMRCEKALLSFISVSMSGPREGAWSGKRKGALFGVKSLQPQHEPEGDHVDVGHAGGVVSQVQEALDLEAHRGVLGEVVDHAGAEVRLEHARARVGGARGAAGQSDGLVG